METGIFYFSATGNSLAAAKALKERFNCPRIINIAEIIGDERIFAAYDRVIVVYPAYAYGMPLAVRRFFKRAEIGKDSYVAALVTYGSRQGGALAEAKRLLRRRGIKLDYARGIPSVENFIPIFGAPSEKTLAERTAMHERAVERICGEIEAGRKHTVRAFRFFPKIVSFIFRLARPLIVKFYKVEDSCTGCGICQKVCPAHSIRLTDGLPEFSGKCELCQCCINWCPQKAISFARVNPETQRYAHGAVCLSEFILKSNLTPQTEEEYDYEPVTETV